MALKLLHRPLLVSGPSGAGKSTFINELLARCGNNFELTVSHTTRKPRQGEQNGLHYYFTNVETFKKMAEEGKFIEQNEVHKNFYGTSRDELTRINDKKKIALLDIDIQGALDVNKYKDEFACNYLFVLPPSIDELKKRLVARMTESDETLRVRLKNAEDEITRARGCGLYGEKDFLVNGDRDSYKDFLRRVYELYGI